MEELKAPFRNEDSDVYRAGLRLVSIEPAVVPCGLQVALGERGTRGMWLYRVLLQYFPYSLHGLGAFC